MEQNENNEKKNKKVILLIVAMFVMIAAVSLTTYAFFTYSRTGEKNNQLVTGRIKLLFEDGVNNINLTNQFPIADIDAITMENNGNEIAVTDFTVSGYAGASVTLNYRVYALAGEAVTGRTRMPDNHIKLYLTYKTNNYGDVMIGYGYDNADTENGAYGALASEGTEGNDTSANGEILLAQGTVGTENTVHTYSLRMWISDTVTISDTDTNATYCASDEECSGTRNIFSDMYYSLKLRVENYDPDAEN